MKILVVAPHPDDELLGCGGTLLRRKSEGCELGWLIVTGISEGRGCSKAKVLQRNEEISQVSAGVGFDQVYNLQFPTTKLDSIPMVDIIQQFNKVFRDFEPEEVLAPHCGDVHSDHRIVFGATSACCKWFRYPSVQRVMTYETLSETEFGLDSKSGFQPNVFINISNFLDRKLELLEIYQGELGEFPFPRSEKSLRSLAVYRGSTAGFHAAEAFQLLNERIS